MMEKNMALSDCKYERSRAVTAFNLTLVSDYLA